WFRSPLQAWRRCSWRSGCRSPRVRRPPCRRRGKTSRSCWRLRRSTASRSSCRSHEQGNHPSRKESPMAFDEALAGRIRRRLARRKNVEERRMFGGIGFLLNGNLLVGVWKESLVVRLGEEEGDEALKEPHVKEFDITGKPMRNWVLVGPEGVKDDEKLTDWIGRATRFVRTLPAKEK